MKAVENSETMMLSTVDYYKQKKMIREEDDNDRRKNYTYYDLHDGKMLYLLTQHSVWNRKEHPFLLCECGRGEGVINNNNHKCKIISNDDQIKLYENSAK